MTIPRIDIDTDVTPAGFSLGAWDVPRYTAGYYWPIGAYPGTVGNITIAGHVGYRDTIFNHLPSIQVGDEVVVYVGDAAHHYRVREVYSLAGRRLGYVADERGNAHADYVRADRCLFAPACGTRYAGKE